MNSELSRRKFIKAGVLGIGTVLSWSVFTNDALAAGNGVKFSVKQGKKGCSRCPDSVNKILKDKAKLAELEKLFPEKSSVVFYVRRHSSKTKVAENAIAIGACSKSLESKCDAFVQGCTRQINPDYVYKTLIEKLAKKEEK